jgi:hypothetical protein
MRTRQMPSRTGEVRAIGNGEGGIHGRKRRLVGKKAVRGAEKRQSKRFGHTKLFRVIYRLLTTMGCGWPNQKAQHMGFRGKRVNRFLDSIMGKNRCFLPHTPTAGADGIFSLWKPPEPYFTAHTGDRRNNPRMASSSPPILTSTAAINSRRTPGFSPDTQTRNGLQLAAITSQNHTTAQKQARSARASGNFLRRCRIFLRSRRRHIIDTSTPQRPIPIPGPVYARIRDAWSSYLRKRRRSEDRRLYACCRPKAQRWFGAM